MILEALSTPIRLTDLKETLTGKSAGPTDPANKDLSKERLKGAVKDLEALFFYEILKEMRQSTEGGFLGKGMGNDIFGSLFDMEMAKLFSERGLGLGEIILKQISGREENKPGSPISPPKELNRSSLAKECFPGSSMDHQSKDRGTGELESKSPPRTPADGRISSGFGWRSDPFSGEQKFHGGIDIAAPSGREIYPINNGRVIFSGLTPGYGNTVVIDHGDGYISKYGHNLTNLVSVGDEVESDQVIALVGNTGKSTGPHLHFEVQHQGKKINPQNLVKFQQNGLG